MKTWHKIVEKENNSNDRTKSDQAGLYIHMRNILLHLSFEASNDRDSQSNSNMYHTKLKLLLEELKHTLVELFKVNKIWVFLSSKIK